MPLIEDHETNPEGAEWLAGIGHAARSVPTADAAPAGSITVRPWLVLAHATVPDDDADTLPTCDDCGRTVESVNGARCASTLNRCEECEHAHALTCTPCAEAVWSA